MSREVTILKLRTLFERFERQVLVRLAEDQTAFICTAKWPLCSIIRRVGVGEAGRDFAPLSQGPPAAKR